MWKLCFCTRHDALCMHRLCWSRLVPTLVQEGSYTSDIIELHHPIPLNAPQKWVVLPGPPGEGGLLGRVVEVDSRVSEWGECWVYCSSALLHRGRLCCCVCCCVVMLRYAALCCWQGPVARLAAFRCVAS